MNPEQTGIVELRDLPKKEVFVSLKKNFHKKLENKIKNYGIFKFCRKLNMGNRIICHWLSDGSLIRLDVLNKILSFFSYKLAGKINFIRGKEGGCIYNPKLPFNFKNKEGVRIIAGILGDGGIPTKKNSPFYSNSNEFQIKGFLNDLNTVLGNIDYSIREIKKKNTIVKIVSLSSLIQKIFLNIGLKKGKKVETNPKIPRFIFDLDESKIYEFLSQMFDDEGSVSLASRHLCIKLNIHSKFNRHNLIDGIKVLFNNLDIKIGVYKIKKNKDRDEWKIEVHRRNQIEKLYDLFKLRNAKKRQKIKLLLNSYKQYHYPFGECRDIYLNSMQKFEEKNGYFTTEMLANDLNRNLGHIRNMVCKYKKEGIINTIEVYTSGNTHYFARHKVVK
ncbi:MAG: LAGLIDADG family homing endonuclease [Nanoarchaeota archaeon]